MNWLNLSNALCSYSERKKGRSAWERGIKVYAREIIDAYTNGFNKNQWYTPLPTNSDDLKHALLNGADSWKQYSYGGFSLIYDSDICNRLCPPSIIRRFENNNYRRPNKREEWLDVQARALIQAFYLLKTIAQEGQKRDAKRLSDFCI